MPTTVLEKPVRRKRGTAAVPQAIAAKQKEAERANSHQTVSREARRVAADAGVLPPIEALEQNRSAGINAMFHTLATESVGALAPTPQPAVAPKKKDAAMSAVITPPNVQRAVVRIVGISPYVQHKFSAKALAMMEATQRAGSQAKKGRKREGRDFEQDYENAKHVSEQGWVGIPAPSFRNAMIDACRLCGFQMTRAKLAVFVEADGYDETDGTPLIKIIGTPEIHKGFARNETGVADIRWRPMWREWSAEVPLRWDADQFSAEDILNLLNRAGLQVGIGEGRPSSPNSYGLGWGLFEVAP